MSGLMDAPFYVKHSGAQPGARVEIRSMRRLTKAAYLPFLGKGRILCRFGMLCCLVFLIAILWSDQAIAKFLGTMDADAPHCFERPPTPANHPALADDQRVQCGYGRKELVDRFTTLLKARSQRLELAEVEKAFGLPTLSTRFRSTRAAWYSITIDGLSPEGKWKAVIQYRETFYPIDETLPPRLSASNRPHALDRTNRGQVMLSLQIINPDREPETGPCRTVAWVVRRALDGGWRDETASAMLPTDEGPKSVVLTRGDMTLSPGIETYGSVPSNVEFDTCFNHSQIDQRATSGG